jgi:hypothetical protein
MRVALGVYSQYQTGSAAQRKIRVTNRLANLVLSLALLSANSVAQETEETTGTVYGVVTADADESCDSSPHGQLGKDLRLFVA